MSEQNNISSTGHHEHERPKLSEERLLAYLEGKLAPEEQHEVELWLADEGMESDAVDGLRELQSMERTHAIGKLNHGLRKKLKGKRGKKRTVGNDTHTIVALLVVLLLAAVAYMVIRYAVK